MTPRPGLPRRSAAALLMRIALCCLTAATATPTSAAPLELPVTIPYGLVRTSLAERVFTGAGESVQVLTDSSRCNSLTLSAPRIEGAGAARLRVVANIVARGGTPVGDSCLLPFRVEGMVELMEEARVAAGGAAIAFRIVDSDILDRSGQRMTIPGVLWGWLKQYVHPRLEAFVFDLAPLLSGTQELLRGAMRATPAAAASSAASVRLREAAASAEALRAVIEFELPVVPADQVPPPPSPPLTAAELAAWDANWQAWDAFATWAIKTVAVPASGELRETLMETLVESRYELRAALAEEPLQADPVRGLFIRTWQRLAPQIARAELTVDGATALRYLALINAADALQALDAAGAPLGLRIDADTLRRLARILLPTVSDEALRYTTAPDPLLRELLGLPPRLELTPSPFTWLDWLIRRARAASIDDELLERLNGWVPSAKDLDAYLEAMDDLLGAIVTHERERGKVGAPYFDVYRILVRATAWQESCWRQFIERNGRIEPIRSSAGALGLMQVNKHVWRGLYDVEALATRVGYNARAGNEILVHYLLDYAIRKKEHEAPGGVDNLARATYAVYNGGPSQLRRYRQPDTKPALRRIDEAFWRKYQTLRESGVDAVKQCYGG